MRRHFLALAALLVAAVVGAYSFLAYKEPVPALASQISSATPAAATTAALAWPTPEAAIGALGYGVLATHGAQTAKPTASVAKLMTALAVLKAKPLTADEAGPTLTLTTADVNSYNAYVSEDGSVAKVAVGEKVSEYQLLEAMLLPSADNVADSLAVWAYGSISTYSAEANAIAKSLGMTNTHIGTADASGYSPQTVSTPYDLILLGQAALRNPVIAAIVAKPTATIPVAGTVRNVNWLLGEHGINGIKTGNTDQAGGVYLFSAKQTFAGGQSVTIIGAIMAEPTLVNALDDAVPLLDSAESHFSLATLVTAGQTLGTYTASWSGTVNAVAARSLSAIVWQGQDTKPKISLKPLHAPITQGTQVGTASFSLAPETVPIVINQAIGTPTWHWRLMHVL